MRRDTFICYDDGVFYFRILGWGLWFASYEKRPPLFSERYGYTTVIPLWKWRIQVLKPRR